jgi:primosomal protein N' (replication factor Y) (superfamily II helicase)
MSTPPPAAGRPPEPAAEAPGQATEPEPRLAARHMPEPSADALPGLDIEPAPLRPARRDRPEPATEELPGLDIAPARPPARRGAVEPAPDQPRTRPAPAGRAGARPGRRPAPGTGRRPELREPAERDPVARIAVDLPLPHLDRPFDYLVPAALDESVVPGSRVRVRFAGQLVDGYVLERAPASEHGGRLSFVERSTSAEPVLSPEIARLARAAADRWAGSLYDVLRLAIAPRHARVEAEPSRPTPPGTPEPGRSTDDGPPAVSDAAVSDPAVSDPAVSDPAGATAPAGRAGTERLSAGAGAAEPSSLWVAAGGPDRSGALAGGSAAGSGVERSSAGDGAVGMPTAGAAVGRPAAERSSTAAGPDGPDHSGRASAGSPADRAGATRPPGGTAAAGVPGGPAAADRPDGPGPAGQDDSVGGSRSSTGDGRAEVAGRPAADSSGDRAGGAPTPAGRGGAAAAPALSIPDGGWRRYVAGEAFLRAVGDGRAARAVWSALPGEDWPARVAAAVAVARAAGRGALVVVPDHRDLSRVDGALAAALGPDRHVALAAELGPAERYRRWLAVRRGAVRAVVGTRAAAFAPVAELGLVVLWDDGDDLHAEPRAPYPHARDLLVLRAHLAGAALLIGGFARTAEAQLLVDSGWAREIRADRDVLRAAAPRVVPVGDDTERGRDSAARTARLPSLAWRAARDALAAGAPVLVQVPRAGYRPVLACARCRTPARCRHCHGPLATVAGDSVPGCRWCGRPAAAWSCPVCANPTMRATVIGAARTAEELGRAFPGIPIRTSGGARILPPTAAGADSGPPAGAGSPDAEPDGGPAAGRGAVPAEPARGRDAAPAAVLPEPGRRRRPAKAGGAGAAGEPTVLDRVPAEAALVVATPGAEPVADGGYGAALLLDGWALLGRPDLRAAEETLRRWMNAAALVRPADAGGQVVVGADGGLAVVQALIRWDPAGYASRELAERTELGFPPAMRFASITGAPDAVADLVAAAHLPEDAEELGPVPAGDGAERLLIRVPRRAAPALARALHDASAVRSARKAPDPVRIQLDPLELL